MKRQKLVQRIDENLSKEWDLIIIGGGATGLGVALDAVSRGYETLLLEQSDFSKGTSSRSTKLVHGGVRYLAQGDVALVREALRERGLLKKNAPHLVQNETFVIPGYKWWTKYYYTIGLTLYDLLSGKLSLGRSKPISKKEAVRRLPTIRQEGLRGGVIYHDGQFDDSRLSINLVQTIVENGGVALNYAEVTGLIKDSNKIAGANMKDMESGKTYALKAKSVINATGVFIDDIMKMDKDEHKEMVRPSQGVHLVLDKEFLPGEDAIMIPKTDDGRVLFAVPWHNKVVVGTTDTPLDEHSLEPVAMEEEIEFILKTAQKYLEKEPTRKDVKSVFAGLRPLAAPKEGDTKTKEISRSHKLIVSDSGLITITGGKWTTFRKMGEDTVDKAESVSKIGKTVSTSEDLKIHGYESNTDYDDPLYFYGSDRNEVKGITEEYPFLNEKLHADYEHIKAEVIWAARNEMARTVEDFLARRIRMLFLDARVAIDMAPEVAELMAGELGYDEDWVKTQVQEFTNLANRYLLEEYKPKELVNKN
ncbi:glycerol-3-phosphate dehydrogenase/oxidase [Gracilimonas sp. Q87]|uniref:glycerol-3-phosphate dehydrogenase/oxidase n=1 Tax=Gracilimonas sp. Q87 TaxID=3384766 RepID=UPI0039842B0B